MARRIIVRDDKEVPEVEVREKCTHPTGTYDQRGNRICSKCGKMISTAHRDSSGMLLAKALTPGGAVLSQAGEIIRENLKTKTLELIAFSVVAVILVTFGFIWAAVGMLFFMMHLYLPNESDILTMARKSSNQLPENILMEMRKIRDEIRSIESKQSRARDQKEIDILESRRGELDKIKSKLEERAEAAGVANDVISEASGE